MAEFALVGKNVNYGQSFGGSTANAALTPNLLAAGAIGAYAYDVTDNEWKLVVSGAASAGQVSAEGLKAPDVTFFLGLGNGDVKQSESHRIRGIRDWRKADPVAPTNQVIHIGSNGTDGNLQVPVLINQGITDALIRLKEITLGYEDYGNIYNFDAGKIYPDDTDDTVADKLVAAVNNHPSGIATAVKESQGNNRGISITINKEGTNYNAAIGGVIELGQVRYTTWGDSGAGTPLQVEDKEQLDRIYRGDFYTASANAYRVSRSTSLVDVEEEYESFWLRSINEGADKTGQKATVDHEVKTWFFFPEGASQAGTLETIVEALLNVSAGPQGPQGPEGPQGPAG